MAHYPADTFQEATEIAIKASNQLHGVINGDANAEVTVEDGSKIPSVRKAMVDSLYFKPPIAWAQGEYEDTYNQLREFVDGDVRTWWFAKGATVSTPILMPTNPATDVNWTLWSAVTLNAATYETQKRFACVADMVSDVSLSVGQIVETVGYYDDWVATSDKPKGGNRYEVVAGGTGTADGGSFITLSNGLQAKGLFLSGIANQKQFGCASDGVTDDAVSAQNFLDCGIKNLRFISGTTLTTKILHIRSNTSLSFDKDAVVRNSRTDSNTYNHSAFSLGNMHPAALDYTSRCKSGNLNAYDVTDIKSGDTTFQFQSPGDGVDFSIGDFVLVRSIAQTLVSGVYIPHFGHISKVTYCDANQIKIADNIKEGITSATISPIKGIIDLTTGLDWNIVENVDIYDPTVDARGLLWTRTGCYNCNIYNASVINGSVPLAVNAFVKSSVNGLESEFEDRALEVKCLSHDSIFSGFYTTHKGSTRVLAGLEIGEQSRDIIVEKSNFLIEAKTGTAGYCLGLGGRRLTVRDSTFLYTGAHTTGSGVTGFIKSSDSFGAYPFNDTVLQNVNFTGDANRTHNLRLGLSTTTSNTGTILLDNVTFNGEKPLIKDVKLERNGKTIITSSKPTDTYELSSTGTAIESVKSSTLIHTNSFGSLTSTTLENYGSARAKAWNFPDAISSSVYVTVPVSANSLSSLKLYFVNMATGAGNFVISVSASLQAVGGTALSSTSTVQKTITAGLQDVVISELFNFTCTNASVMLIRITRDGANVSDTLTNAVGLIAAEVKSA